MAFPPFVFLQVACLLLALALLWRLDWFPLRPASSQGAAKRTTLHRLLKPRCLDDCLACRLTSTPVSASGQTPTPVLPWCEVKGRRGTPKRGNTKGFACPNTQCAYCGITDAEIHSLRELLTPDCIPLFTSDGLHLYFYALRDSSHHSLTGIRLFREVEHSFC